MIISLIVFTTVIPCHFSFAEPAKKELNVIYQEIEQYHSTLAERKVLLKKEAITTPAHHAGHQMSNHSTATTDHPGMNHGPLEQPSKTAYQLAEQFIFAETTYLQQLSKLQEIKKALAMNSDQDFTATLTQLKNHYPKWLNLLDQIEESVAAEKRAIQTKADCNMFFQMKARTPVSAKGKEAFGLMDQAVEARDQGRFAEAFALWQKSEILVQESYNDRLAEMIEWREQAKRNVNQHKEEMRSQVTALLKDYFVVLPEGKFTMGSATGSVDEQPQHPVQIKSFKMGKNEIPFALYDICVESAACYAKPKDETWGRHMQPVIYVSYKDITQQFIPWLNDLTQQNYRLPSEAEWEYAARAGTTDDVSWGVDLNCAAARFDGGINSPCNAKLDSFRGPSPVKHYAANAFGLYDMHGNVWEWVLDCWHDSYDGAPTNGSPWQEQNCAAQVLRGGAWDFDKNNMRPSNRYSAPATTRRNNFGFRLAQDHP